jgi:hypothetical protein
MLGAVDVQPIDRRHAADALNLLGELRLSLFGVQSRRLHTALVDDGLRRRIDFRIALDANGVCGVVLTAPASFWLQAPVMHWGLALECLQARITGGGSSRHPVLRADAASNVQADSGAPLRTWSEPGDAWRVILIGTAERARGRGVAAQLYRSVMADRSLVARIALDNGPSLRLHRSLGWRLYRDADVVTAVYVRDHSAAAGTR